jgi:tetratricopeptide (TPR) repeat protein
MRKPMAFAAAASLCAASLAATGAQAQGPAASTGSMTTFSGGGYADACADFAMRGLTGVQAEQACTQALEFQALLPLDRAGTLVNLGVIRLRSGRYADANADFSTAIKYMPDLAEAYVNRGAARIGLRQFKDAVADVDKALELGVKEPQKAYYDRGLAYEWLDNPKAAYADYKKALEIAPAWDLAREQMYRFSVTHAELIEPAAAAPAAKP